MSRITLALFDIDGTILHCGNAGRQSFSDGLKAAFGHDDDLSHLSFAGCTDTGLINQILAERNQACNEDERNRFFAELPPALERRLNEEEPTLYPGVRGLLDVLNDHDH
ncbi:MAG: hypothetical protein AAF492_32610, partial [Verrucomicrobiota bacterium]